MEQPESDTKKRKTFPVQDDASLQGRYLDTVNRRMLDFDFEKVSTNC